jgi:hypothetical protein
MSDRTPKKKYRLFDRKSKLGKLLSTWQSLFIVLDDDPSLPPYEVIDEDKRVGIVFLRENPWEKSKLGKFLSIWQSLFIVLDHDSRLPPYEVIDEEKRVGIVFKW